MPGQLWLEQVSATVGRDVGSSAIASKGFRFEGGQLLLGETGGEVLLPHAGIIRSSAGIGTRVQEGYARSILKGPLSKTVDVPLSLDPSYYETSLASNVFSQKINYIDEAGKKASETFMITGGKTKIQAASRYLKGYSTSLIERFNQLARSPFELPIVSDILQRIPLISKLKFGVTPSSGLRTLGKLTAKLGFGATALALSYGELDYQTRKSTIFDNTIFAEGLTTGLATAWTRGQMALSNVAEFTGGHAIRERQEEIAPRSTEIQKLLAFPIAGAFAGLSYNYLKRLSTQFKYRRADLSLSQAAVAAESENAFFKQAIYNIDVPEDTKKLFSSKSVALIESQTDKLVASKYGRFAQWSSKQILQKSTIGSILKKFGTLTPSRMRWMGGAAIGAALIAPFIPGALVPSERPEELEAIYSGRKEVAIRKGRWWEMGRSDYSGNRIEYYRPHWYPRMVSRAREKSIWGDDAPSPWEQFYKANFTYDIEAEHYRSRPYPQASPAFEDIPFLGPVLGATIGSIIKPPILMHQSEWMRGKETLDMPLRFGEQIIPGELEKGSPVDPYNIEGTISEQVYNISEQIGLPGFVMTSIKEAVTGTPGLFDQEMRLATSGDIASHTRKYWDLNLGGGLGMTELYRRLYPHRQNQIPLYNPIPNAFANVDWLPGAGDRSINFKIGDPFAAIPEGDLRLPGRGYAALNPEVKGLSLNEYPLIHKYKILSDIAMYSENYKEVERQVRGAIGRGHFTKEEIARYKEIKEQVQTKKQKREFNPYLYRDRARTPIEEILAAENIDKQTNDTEASWFESALGSYWETLAHEGETSAEYLTPISPVSKLTHMRTATEDYARTQMWGSEYAFWQHPLRDFIYPFLTSTGKSLGYDAVPAQIEERREFEEYFDILKYIKFTRLKADARRQGERELTSQYESKRRETLFGINPYTYDYTHIMRALPRRDRDYFNDFVKADMEERIDILDMVPENERALYLARWELKDVKDMQKAVKKGLLSEEQIEKARAITEDMYTTVKAEGLPTSQQLFNEYISTRNQGESYADWYRRTKLLEKKLEGRPLPGPDWIGFSPLIDLDDIKMKIVSEEGKNAFDYDLWPDRLRNIARRPIISEAADELRKTRTVDEVRRNIDELLSQNNIKATSVRIMPIHSDQTVVNLELEEDRGYSSRDAIRRTFNNG